MGHWNARFTGQIVDLEMDRQGRRHLHPDPCIFFGNVPNFPVPVHPAVPPLANQHNFSFQPMPERHESALVYGMPQLNGIPPQHTAPTGHYNLYLEHPSGSYDCSVNYLDSIRGSFKRKIAEGPPGNFHHHNALSGPSSFVPPVTSMPPDHDITMMDSASHLPPRAIDPTPVVGMRLGSILDQGDPIAPAIPLPRTPWLDVGTFAPTHAPTYMHGYQVAANNGSRGFLPPALPQNHPSRHCPPLPVHAGGYSVNFPSQVATPSNTGINSFHDVGDPRAAAFLGPVPVPQMGLPFHRPRHQGIIHGSTGRRNTHPHFSSEYELASTDIPGQHEAGDYIDQHSDMRLDIDHMSYEELLALGEQIGNVVTGLSEEFIQNNLKIRKFSSSDGAPNLEEATYPDGQINFCVICQSGYEDGEDIGRLGCGHEYHSGCIKKWLGTKNSCPVCKSTGLS